mgnify:CR=1 FL=1
MLKILMLQKKRTALQTQLKQLRTKRKQLRADETALQEQVDQLEEITPELEQQVDELSQQQTETDDQIAELQDQIEELDNQIADLEADDGSRDTGEDDNARAAGTPPARRSAAPVVVASRNFVSRSRCFGSREARDAFYARPAVKDFLSRVRGIRTMGKRSVTGAELTIPTEVLDIIRENLEEYSKLISRVRLRSVRGRSRQNIMGDIPEGVWMEMSGALNELEFSISELEMDGYKAGGIIIIDNYLLEDSDINLGEEILYMLGQSIGYAVDKAIAYGLGRTSKMPVGFVTRLAQTSQPDYWGDSQGTWTDLHSTNVLKLDLATKNGTEFFITLLQALAKAKPKKTRGPRTWIMNEQTKTDIMIRSLGINSAATIVAGMENAMPVIGGEIVTLEFVPDNEIIGGYLDMYVLAEREGGTFGASDLPLFIQDKTVYKGTARYDGQPAIGESFVAVSYDNTEVTTSMDFKPDYAGDGLNALIVTSAAGSVKDTTILTVAGAVSSTNKLMAHAGAPVAVVPGLIVNEKDWTAITSGTGDFKAKNGSGVTVIEVDKDGHAVSAGYLASATSKTS